MENEEWRMGNEEWEIENGKLNFFLFTLTFYNVEYIFSAAIIDIHVLFLATLCSRIKGYDNGRSHTALFIYLTT